MRLGRGFTGLRTVAPSAEVGVLRRARVVEHASHPSLGMTGVTGKTQKRREKVALNPAHRSRRRKSVDPAGKGYIGKAGDRFGCLLSCDSRRGMDSPGLVLGIAVTPPKHDHRG